MIRLNGIQFHHTASPKIALAAFEDKGEQKRAQG